MINLKAQRPERREERGSGESGRGFSTGGGTARCDGDGKKQEGGAPPPTQTEVPSEKATSSGGGSKWRNKRAHMIADIPVRCPLKS